jgi:hypothetical protein
MIRVGDAGRWPPQAAGQSALLLADSPPEAPGAGRVGLLASGAPRPSRGRYYPGDYRLGAGVRRGLRAAPGPGPLYESPEALARGPDCAGGPF